MGRKLMRPASLAYTHADSAILLSYAAQSTPNIGSNIGTGDGAVRRGPRTHEI